MSEIIDGLPDTDYHARAELGSTSVKTLAKYPPAVFKYWLDNPEPPKAVYEIGTVAHSVILEDSWDGVEIIDVDDKRGKKWSDPADEARAAGKIPLTAAEGLMIADMKRSVMSHPEARRLLTGHQSEVSYFAERDGVGVKARLDALNGGIAIDLKTSVTADPDELGRQFDKYGYQIQQAHYLDVMERCGQMVDDFVFIFVEKTAPYLVSVVRLDPVAVDLGAVQTAHALTTYKQCTTSGEWPGYQGITDIDLPPWAYNELEDTEIVIK